MKKFMTVLLVIAVMFTFSFSTAFAGVAVPGTTTTYQQKLDAAEAELAKELAAAKTGVVEKLADKYTETVTGTTLTIGKAVYVTVAEKVYADYMTVLKIAKSELEAAYTSASCDTLTADDVKTSLTNETVDSSTTYAGKKVADALETGAFNGMVIGVDVAVTDVNERLAYITDIMKNAFQPEKDRIIGELNKIDVSLYSDDVMDKTNDAYKTTYAQLAQKTKDALIVEAGKVVITPASSATQIADKVAELQGILTDNTAVETVSTFGNIVINYSLVGVELNVGGNTTALVTKEALGLLENADAATKANLKAYVQNQAASALNSAVTAYNSILTDASKNATEKAEAKAAYELAQKRINAFIDNRTLLIDEEVVTSTAACDYTTDLADRCIARLDVYKALEAQANVLKLQVEKDGTAKYIASKIDENLADAQILAYSGSSYAATVGMLTEDAKNEAENLAWEKEVAIAGVKDALDVKLYNKNGACKYYDIEKEKITAKYDEIIAKINAATTVEQIAQINKTPVLTGIDNEKAAVRTNIANLYKFSTEYAKIDAYVDYMNTGINPWEDGYRTLTPANLAKFYAGQGARTNDEIVALLDAAKAWADTIPTKKEIKDARVAAEALIAALPNVITSADKATVKAAYDAADACVEAPTNKAKLDSAITAVNNAEKKVIDKMFDALPALNKVTVADKAAVEAVAAAVKEYNTTSMYPAVYDASVPTTLSLYKAAVRDASMYEVAAKIAALPAAPTKAEVEAVRAAVDAFVAEFTSASADYNAIEEITNIDKLLFAEAEVAEEEAAAAEKAKVEAIAAIEGLKIKANSSAKKGSITVKWTVSEEVEGVKYQVYKSTKAQKGYKKSITTSKTTFKNTKNLKKGTRYYYKVRAIGVVDGVTYYSDWSNKANRIAK